MSANNIVTKTDLEAFYQSILPYLNGNALSYSTSEQDTGKRWIDGKKIYQKTYTGLSMPQAATAGTIVTLSTSLTSLSISKIISYEAFGRYGNGELVMMPFSRFADNTANGVRVRVSPSAIMVDNNLPGWNNSGMTFEVTVKYTKTS